MIGVVLKLRDKGSRISAFRAMHWRCITAIVCSIIMQLTASNACANELLPTVEVDPHVAALENFLVVEYEHGNLLDIKLTIDALIDQDHDAEATRSIIESMVRDLEGLTTPDMPDDEKADVLRTYLYHPGAWNKGQVFSYDHDDPLGQSESSRLLHNYLETRKGNCVSMPVLHAILGQEIGLNMTLSTAPLHVFIKYTPEGGETINLEATSGGYPARDAWYKKNLPMLPKAIKNGMFLADLTQEEAVAVIAHDLVVHLTRSGNPEAGIVVAERLIEVFPNYAPLHMSRGSATFKIIERDFQAVYPDVNDIPSELRPTFVFLMRENAASFQTADRLGWADPDELLEQAKQ